MPRLLGIPRNAARLKPIEDHYSCVFRPSSPDGRQTGGEGRCVIHGAPKARSTDGPGQHARRTLSEPVPIMLSSAALLALTSWLRSLSATSAVRLTRHDATFASERSDFGASAASWRGQPLGDLIAPRVMAAPGRRYRSWRNARAKPDGSEVWCGIDRLSAAAIQPLPLTSTPNRQGANIRRAALGTVPASNFHLTSHHTRRAPARSEPRLRLFRSPIQQSDRTPDDKPK
jgi:hypothetical protein